MNRQPDATTATARQEKARAAAPSGKPPRRPRWKRILYWALALLVGLPVGLIVVALCGILIFANIPYGQRTIERQTLSLTGGMVEIQGMGGFFPTRLHIGRLTIHDHLGPYLVLDDARLNWSPFALVHKTVHASLLSAQSLRFDRLPVSDPAAPPAPSTPSALSTLHYGIDLDRLDIGRIDLGKDLAGFPLSASAQGHMRLSDLAPVLDGLKPGALPVATLGLDIRRLDKPANINLSLATPAKTLDLHLAFDDSAGGLVAQATKMAVLDPLSLRLDLKGPVVRNTLALSLHAGAIAAKAQGAVDLTRHQGDLAIKASTPAMSPMTGIAWSAIALNAELHGDLIAPSGSGVLDIDSLAAANAGIGHLNLRFTGDEGQAAKADKITLALRADGVRAPGVPAALLAQAPVLARMTALPNTPEQNVSLSVTHPLFQLSAATRLKPDIQGALDLILPDLASLAAIGKVDLAGHSVTHADFTYRPKGESHLTLHDSLAVTGGMKQAVALLGANATFKLDVAASPESGGARTLTLNDITVDGKALHLHDTGVVTLGQKMALSNDALLAIADLKAVAPQLHGHAALSAHTEGPVDDLAAKAQLKGEIGASDVPPGPLTLDLSVLHLPTAPQGTLTAGGRLDGRKLDLDASFARHEDGSADLLLNALDWASLAGKGHLTLASGAKLPLGTVSIVAKSLNDFSALAGRALGGHVALDVKTSDPAPNVPPVMSLAVKGSVQAAPARIGNIDLTGRIANPVDKPDLDLRLVLGGVAFQAMTGNATLGARGPLDALALNAKAAFSNVMAAPASLDTAMLLDLPGKHVRLERLAAVLKGETLHLSGASTISFGDKMGVDRLQASVAPAGVSPATIDIAGFFKPRLDLHVRLAHVTPALAKPFAPGLDASGVLAAQADLSGDLARPAGTIALTLSDLHMRSGTAEALPPLSMQANATLAGTMAQIRAQASAGKSVNLRVAGTAPTGATGALGLKIDGGVDLAVANPVLGAQGMSLTGKTAIDLALSGPASAPMASGRVTLEKINFAHYGQGVRLSDINGVILAANDTLTLQNILAHAGKGTIALSGTVGALRPGLPLDIHVTARKAQPVTSDLLTAVIDTDLRAHGQLSTRIDVDGDIRLPSVIVNIPSSMPASIPQLTVIRPGETREAVTRSMVIGLDMNVISPGNFFVRGHGLDAEMSGKLHIGGVSTAPDISGGFDLKRGFFNLAGVNLTFTKGRVAFDGSGVDHKLDPSLDFRADRNVQGTLASLLVGGYASAPKIDFSSQPSLPRDQVLAMLLFGSTTASLSPTQLASLAAAVAQITGGSSFDPLDKVRGFLGLDRLAVGGGSAVGNGGASVEAGKYVMKGVYVGAKQATSGSGTQAQVQVDLTKRLKLNTTVGTGGQITGFTTPENDPGSSIGLSYGFDY